MSGTHRGSISIQIPDGPVDEGHAAGGRWARVELGDFFWIGRASICNLRIQGDVQVSRLHAIIHRDGHGYRLFDMQSRNGTKVNGRKVKGCPLVPGDRVKVGKTLFEFEPDFAEDTFFREGTSRAIGEAEVEIKQFPSSISVPVDEIAAMKVARARTPDPSSLEEFLTIVVDRLVSELSARKGVLYLPQLGARPPLTIARGIFQGKLERLEEPAARIDRISHQFDPVPDGEPPEEGQRLVWRHGQLEMRLSPDDPRPRGLGEGWAFTIALPRVGRAGEQHAHAARTRGLAWMHVEDAAASRSVARLVEEVASAVNASVIRFLERGTA